MINPEELAICKRRGHQNDHFLDKGWQQCTACGAWIREVRNIEEREEDPPEAEMSAWERFGRSMDEVRVLNDSARKRLL